MALRLFATFVATGHALSLQPTAFLAPDPLFLIRANGSIHEDGVGECRVPAGQVLFLHVMKAGGTSVDAFLACHCKRVGCSMKLSLGTYADRHGIKKCERPSVCSTHGNYRNRKA